MDSSELTTRVAEIRRFFRYTKPQEWAATQPAEALVDVAHAFALAEQRMQQEAEALVPELAAAERIDLIQQLINNSRRELLVALCRGLVACSYAAAVPHLLREYKGAASESRHAILTVVQATGSTAGYGIVLAAVTDQVPAVREQAAAALTAIHGAHPALRVLAAVVSGTSEGSKQQPYEAPASTEQVPTDDLCKPLAPEPTTTELVEALVAILPLGSALSALSRLVATDSTVAGPVRHQLLRLAEERHYTREDDGDEPSSSQRPLLLLASQDWDLPAPVARQSTQAFHRASRDERVLLLKSAPPAVTGRLLAQGLDPDGRKLLEQSLAHLEDDVPEVVPGLHDELLAVVQAAGAQHAARALVLLAHSLPEDQQVRHGLPNRLLRLLAQPETNALHRRSLEALLASEPGRQKLATEPLPGGLWPELTGLLRTAAGRSLQGSLFSTLAAGLAAWSLLDSPRLDWLLRHADKVEPAVLTEAVPPIAEAVAAHVCYGPPDALEPLLAAIAATPGLWERLGSHVLPRLAGSPADRLQLVLRHLDGGTSGLFTALTAALTRTQQTLQVLLESMGDCADTVPEQVVAWLQDSKAGPFYQTLMLAEAERLREEITAAGSALQAADRLAHQSLEDNASQVLEDLDQVLADGAADYPHLVTSLTEYVQELGDAIYAVIDEPMPPFPVPLPPTGDSLHDFLQLQVLWQTAKLQATQAPGRLLAKAGQSTGLPMDKLLLALREQPARTAVAARLAEWIESLGLHPIEPIPGVRRHRAPQRHVAIDGDTGTGEVEVLTLGLLASDGSVLRPAVVTLC